MSDHPTPRHFSLPVFLTLLLLALLPSLVVLLPNLEERFLPVITDHQETFTRTGHTVVTFGTFNKRRPDCLIEVARFDFKPEKGAAVEVVRGAKLNRALGGVAALATPYEISPDATFPGHLRRTFYYRCHPLWLTPYHFRDLWIE